MKFDVVGDDIFFVVLLRKFLIFILLGIIVFFVNICRFSFYLGNIFMMKKFIKIEVFGG